MQCTIPGENVKVFGKAVHCLSRIGEDLYFEASSNQLALRTVNSSRSAYCCFLFQREFFEVYATPGLDNPGRPDTGRPSNELDGDAEETLLCKASNKACVGVFRSLSLISKMVDRCKLEFDQHSSRLVFRLFCRHGIVKTYRLHVEDCESLKAVYARDQCPNVIVSAPHVLSDCIGNFQAGLDEITFHADPRSLKVTNPVGDADEFGGQRTLRTQLTIQGTDFHKYSIGEATNVTFCLKELKAILSFVEFSSEDVSMHFETSGKPIVFAVTCFGFEADFVLATLVDSEPPLSSARASSSTPSQTPRGTPRYPSSAHTPRHSPQMPAATGTSRGMSSAPTPPTPHGHGAAPTSSLTSAPGASAAAMDTALSPARGESRLPSQASVANHSSYNFAASIDYRQGEVSQGVLSHIAMPSVGGDTQASQGLLDGQCSEDTQAPQAMEEEDYDFLDGTPPAEGESHFMFPPGGVVVAADRDQMLAPDTDEEEL